MFERYTSGALKAMDLANQEAQRFNHEYIGTEHILLGVIAEGGAGSTILKEIGTRAEAVRAEIEAILKPGPPMVTIGKLAQSRAAKEAIWLAIEEARSLGKKGTGTEHLLLGVMRAKDSVAARVLSARGISLEDVRARCDGNDGLLRKAIETELIGEKDAGQLFEAAVKLACAMRAAGNGESSEALAKWAVADALALLGETQRKMG